MKNSTRREIDDGERERRGDRANVEVVAADARVCEHEVAIGVSTDEEDVFMVTMAAARRMIFRRLVDDENVLEN